MQALNILVVEDHEDSARALARLLRHEGHHATTAGGFGEALSAAARAGRIDVLISDISLGDGEDSNGCALLRVLRERRGGGPRCAVALTGHADDHWVEECRRAGYDQFLLKPVAFEELGSIIRSLADKPAPPRQARSRRAAL